MTSNRNSQLSGARARVIASAFSLFACSLTCAGLNSRSAEVVQLSNGETVKVFLDEEITADSTGKKVSLTTGSLLFEDSLGTRVVVKTKTTPDGRAETVFRSPDGKTEIRFEVDLGFGRKGLPDPVVVIIDGERYYGLLDLNSPAASQKLLESTASAIRRVPEPFKDALRQLFRLGASGYANLGIGWPNLLYVFDPSDLTSQTISAVTTTTMRPEERDLFVAGFAGKLR